MDDTEILAHIERLVAEERGLERSHVGEGLAGDQLDRLHAVEIALDQCWDLLRQRHARRGAGGDPGQAAVRPPGVVEGYQQ